MSIISFDFISVEAQIKKLELYSVSLERANERIHSVIGSVSEMSLGESFDELKMMYNRFEEEKNYLDNCILKLKKISELYGTCEREILTDIENLSFNIADSLNNRIKLSNNKNIAIYCTPINTFSGHSIVNDDWLEELIF